MIRTLKFATLVFISLIVLGLVLWLLTSECKVYLLNGNQVAEQGRDCKCLGIEFEIPNTNSYQTMCTGILTEVTK